ncbi:hypothetical protein ACYCHH_18435, partial [Klebsiella pneumoniae]
VYSQTTPQQRARFLNAIADELDALGEPFFGFAGPETALPGGGRQGGPAPPPRPPPPGRLAS